MKKRNFLIKFLIKLTIPIGSSEIFNKDLYLVLAFFQLDLQRSDKLIESYFFTHTSLLIRPPTA